jgi:hypothetical protein
MRGLESGLPPIFREGSDAAALLEITTALLVLNAFVGRNSWQGPLFGS